MVASCSELNRTSDELTQNAQVYAEDAFNTAELAKSFSQKNRSEDFDKAAEDLRLATRNLAKIVGKVDVEEILDSIFNDFCIGK